MATVQTLKDKNNNTFYPVTKTEAVYNADGSETLDNTIDNLENTKATISTSVGDANKMMKADGTKALVTSDNIDFTTFPDTTLSISDVSPIAGIVDYSSTFKFSCHKSKAGVVQLFLAIKNSSGSSIAAYTSLLKLPVGYLPVARIHQLIKSDGTTVEILTNGYLQLSGALADGGGVNTTLCFLTS